MKLPYTNKEISWLSFNGRVLQEAADSSVPLFERILPRPRSYLEAALQDGQRGQKDNRPQP